MRSGGLRFLRDGRGQSIIELALAAPILVFALIGGLDLMRVAAVQQAVQNAARAGADVISQDNTVAEDTVRRAIGGELNNTPGLPAVTSIALCSGGGNPCANLPPRQNGVYQGMLADQSASCSSNVSSLCYVRVEVVFTFNTIVPWPLVPNTIRVDRDIWLPLLG